MWLLAQLGLLVKIVTTESITLGTKKLVREWVIIRAGGEWILKELIHLALALAQDLVDTISLVANQLLKIQMYLNLDIMVVL
jgi:hypothetical protein